MSTAVEELTAHPENYKNVIDLQGMDRALVNTTLVTLLVVYRPDWVAGFDDSRYLLNK